MSDEPRTAEQKAQDYTAMGHSVDLINAVIDGSQMSEEDAEERQGAVDRNVEQNLRTPALLAPWFPWAEI